MFNFTPDLLLARFIVVLFGIPIHEWAHGFAAHLLGDTTPEREGRLSLNPFTHLDPIGTLMILLTGFGWGRAARVNPYQMRKAPTARIGMALTALAGPFSNFIQAGILALILRFLTLNAISGGATQEFIVKILFDAIAVNILLIAFNMLPIPPLDGSRVLAGVAPPKVADFIENLEPIAPYILLAVLFILPQIGINLVSWLTLPLYQLLARLFFSW